MQKIEKTFDINSVLLHVFSSLGAIRKEKNIELIYEMDATIPKDLKGDVNVFSRLLIEVLTFVFNNTNRKEIVLSLYAPDDFLVEEFISFKINDTNIPKENISAFLEDNIKSDLEILEGKIIYDKNSDIYFDIPFQIHELGYRRHYRLPNEGMLDKKVLLLSESEKITQSIKKMFMYFHYDVVDSFEAFKKQGSDLSQYDIVVIDEHFATEALAEIIIRIQKEVPLKYVLIQNSHISKIEQSEIVSTHLIKPVTQESVFELIAALFHSNTPPVSSRGEVKKYVVDLEKIMGTHYNHNTVNTRTNDLTSNNFNHILEEKKELKLSILDTQEGEKNCKQAGLTYKKELKKFLEAFDRSDLYFRQIVNERSSNKIKSFCIDLEKQSKLIGAQSMLRLAGIISLIFVHDKLDMLPIYPGRYHIELQKLLGEIKKQLGIK